MIAAVSVLTWSELESAATHSLDVDMVRAVTQQRLSIGAPSPDDLERALDRDLLHAFGAWVAGWNWATSEPGCGGPIRAWCCADHSLPRGEELTEPAVERVVSAVAEWHAFLGELSREFDVLCRRLEDLPLEEAVERAAAYILPLTLDRTGAEDAWYGTFTVILTWFLESFGFDVDAVAPVVEQVASGRFQSWVGPGPEDFDAAVRELGVRVVQARPSEEDATAAWRSNRTTVFRVFDNLGLEDSPRPPVKVDGHRTYIDTVDARRDPVRAELMHQALDLCRESASREEALSLALLQTWLQHLIVDPTIRKDVAWARGGRVNYGTFDVVKLDAALRQANNHDESVAVRAARVYLDVCFFHPFRDGNARAARLALDHVLTREGLVLQAADPLFRLCRSAQDPFGAQRFVHAVEGSLGQLLT